MWGMRAIIPQKLQHLALQCLHEGHNGVVKLRDLLKAMCGGTTLIKILSLKPNHVLDAWQ